MKTIIKSNVVLGVRAQTLRENCCDRRSFHVCIRDQRGARMEGGDATWAYIIGICGVKSCLAIFGNFEITKRRELPNHYG